MKKQGVTFVIRTLRGGGAEKVMVTLANSFHESGRPVTVITSIPKKSGDEDAYYLNPEIPRIKIPYWNIPIPIFQHNYIINPLRLHRLRNEIIKAGNDIVIPFMEKSLVGVCASIDCYKYRVVGGLQGHPGQMKPGKITRWLWKRYYRRAHCIIGLSQNWLEAFDEGTIIPSKFSVIPNFTPDIDLNAKPNPDFELPEEFICATGRLHPQKGFDLLIPVFARISKQYPNLHLVIFGEGEERQNLRYLADIIGIKDKVHMPGFVSNPHSLIKKAKMFVLSSRHEGMPMSLLEMMSIEMPVVSFNCPTGPEELIENDVNGLLVERENQDHLEKAIIDLLDHPEKAKSLAKEAAKIKKDFSKDMLLARWNALLDYGKVK